MNRKINNLILISIYLLSIVGIVWNVYSYLCIGLIHQYDIYGFNLTPERMEILDLNTKEITIYDFPFDINGFEYQVISFIKTLENNEIENKTMQHQTTIDMLKIMDEIRKQIGVVYNNEKR